MTAPPKGITARRFIRALTDDGFSLSRTRGSHRIYRHPDGRRVVVAYHRLSDTSGQVQSRLVSPWGPHPARRRGRRAAPPR